MVGLISVAIIQKINLLDRVVVAYLGGLTAIIWELSFIFPGYQGADIGYPLCRQFSAVNNNPFHCLPDKKSQCIRSIY